MCWYLPDGTAETAQSTTPRSNREPKKALFIWQVIVRVAPADNFDNIRIIT